MDRPAFREGRVVGGAIWMSALGGEVLYEEDLPACCRRSARGQERSFECPACGAMWQTALPMHPEEDAFSQRDLDERKGAA